VFNRDLKFKVGIASRETIRFLTLRQLMISKTQRSWRKSVTSYEIFRPVYKQLHAGQETTFDAS